MLQLVSFVCMPFAFQRLATRIPVLDQSTSTCLKIQFRLPLQSVASASHNWAGLGWLLNSGDHPVWNLMKFSRCCFGSLELGRNSRDARADVCGELCETVQREHTAS